MKHKEDHRRNLDRDGEQKFHGYQTTLQRALQSRLYLRAYSMQVYSKKCALLFHVILQTFLKNKILISEAKVMSYNIQKTMYNCNEKVLRVNENVIPYYTYNNEDVDDIGLGAFAASELDKVFSGYQPC
jgi:hypothetical protein